MDEHQFRMIMDQLELNGKSLELIAELLKKISRQLEK